mmetsp:Transcript_20169/g.49424  ORF Transcript_20169/g.49424 Transcript_20169/m.49424 type:complete len:207 (+) Transcript_20169:416-1036(+)
MEVHSATTSLGGRFCAVGESVAALSSLQGDRNSKTRRGKARAPQVTPKALPVEHPAILVVSAMPLKDSSIRVMPLAVRAQNLRVSRVCNRRLAFAISWTRHAASKRTIMWSKAYRFAESCARRSTISEKPATRQSSSSVDSEAESAFDATREAAAIQESTKCTAGHAVTAWPSSLGWKHFAKSLAWLAHSEVPVPCDAVLDSGKGN